MAFAMVVLKEQPQAIHLVAKMAAKMVLRKAGMSGIDCCRIENYYAGSMLHLSMYMNIIDE